MLALFLLTAQVLAGDVDRAWLDRPVALTNADLLDLYSGIVTARINQSPGFPKMIVQIQVRLVDADGDTHFDLVLDEVAIAKLQKLPPGQQTEALAKLHGTMADSLAKVGGEKSGAFHDHEAYTTAVGQSVVEFLRARGASDIVLSIGFARGAATFRYASVSEGHVDFDPACPTAKE